MKRRSIMSRWGAGCVVLLVLCGLCLEASAQPLPAPHRRYGIGSAIGAGYLGGSATGGSFAGTVGVLLPTMELRFFNRRGGSVDLSVPISNTLVAGAFARIFAWSTDVYYNFNLGPGRVRFLAAPGLGFAVLAGYGAGGVSLRVPAILGVEFLSPGRGFGFQIRGRPHFEVGYASSGSSSLTAIGGGFMAELAFIGYATGRTE